jgi:hypothetical protein
MNSVRNDVKLVLKSRYYNIVRGPLSLSKNFSTCTVSGSTRGIQDDKKFK